MDIRFDPERLWLGRSHETSWLRQIRLCSEEILFIMEKKRHRIRFGEADMAELLHLLHQEHTNIGKLLTICERVVGSLATPDVQALDMVCEVLEYMQAYPDVWHHPLEDAILKKLENRDVTTSKQIGDLEKHHEALAELTSESLAITKSILADETVSRDVFRQSVMLFVEKYRDHIRMEEELFFPAARRTLTEADWEEIKNDFADPGDPLFGSKASEHFMRLRFEIFQNDGAYG